MAEYAPVVVEISEQELDALRYVQTASPPVTYTDRVNAEIVERLIERIIDMTHTALAPAPDPAETRKPKRNV